MYSQTTSSYELSISEMRVLEEASQIIERRYARYGTFNSAEAAKAYLHLKMGAYTSEVFAMLMLDSQHQLIEYVELFQGTINQSPVFPREVVKAALAANASTVILAHNHPSGVSEPSRSDKEITTRLKQALELVDIRVLDHIVVGKTPVSFTELGLL